MHFRQHERFDDDRVWDSVSRSRLRRTLRAAKRRTDAVGEAMLSSGATGASQRKRPKLGVLEWFEIGEHRRVERVVRELQELGVRHLRTGVSWADWHVPGGERWYAWLLPRLAEDFELLPCLHHTPPARGAVPTIQSPPKRPRDFADFVDAFLNRFDDLFETLELWNEPSNLNDWDWRLDTAWHLFTEMIGD